METKGQFGEVSLNGLTADPQEELVTDLAEVDADASGGPGRGKNVLASAVDQPHLDGKRLLRGHADEHHRPERVPAMVARSITTNTSNSRPLAPSGARSVTCSPNTTRACARSPSSSDGAITATAPRSRCSTTRS